MDVALILNKPRWKPLQRFVERWYREPLGLTSLPVAEIETVEKKLGRRFPLVVREWYVLVGHRFDDVNQDWPERLHEQTGDGNIALWSENQGNWSIEVPAVDSDDDLAVVVEGEEYAPTVPATATQALLGMVYSDTLVGVWSGAGVGPLGPLAPTVVGGMISESAPGTEERLAALPKLDVWPNPYFAEPPRGHESLVIRGYEWMAATPEAEAEVAAIFGLHELARRFVLELSLASVTLDGASTIQSFMTSESSMRASDGLARFSRGSYDGASAEVELETRHPIEAFKVLEAHLERTGIRIVSARYRDENRMTFTNLRG